MTETIADRQYMNSDIEIFDSENIRYIGNSAFHNCRRLRKVILRKDICSIGMECFENCEILDEIIFEDGIQLDTIPTNFLRNCKNIRNLRIPESVTFIADYAFRNCSSLSDVTLTDNITYIGDNAFRCCGNLRHMKLPDGLIYLGNSAFEVCNELVDIELPKTLTTINHNTFKDSGLSGTIDLTMCNEIKSNAFQNCVNLENVMISENVIIGDYAFLDCVNMNSEHIQNRNRYAVIGCKGQHPDHKKIINNREFEVYI